MLARGPLPHRSSLILAILLAIITILAYFNALLLASSLAQTSDSAQGFVVGHAIANGNILLSGWHFPIDSFYFTDSIPYAAAEAIAGPRLELMVVVPALVYACLVILALVLCVRPGEPLSANLEPVAAATLLFALPVWTGVWDPMLMSDMHMATVVAALASLSLFARLATAELRGAIAVFAALLAFLSVVLTTASDPFSLVFAFGPAAAVFAVEAIRSPHSPKIRSAIWLLGVAITVGLLLPWIIARIGGFTTENDVTFGFAPAARWRTNLLDVVFSILTLTGTNPSNVQKISDSLMFALRFAALGLVFCVLGNVARSLMRGEKLALLDRLLGAGAAVSLVVCIPSAQFAKGVKPELIWQAGAPMRFVLPAVLFASIVACRRLASGFYSWPNVRMRVRFRNALLALAGLVFFTGTMQFFFSGATTQRSNKNPGVVADWLARHRLFEGAGEYWSANLLTAMSGNSIGVRSMVPDDRGLVPYVWVEAQDAYARPPQFAVWQEPNQTGWTEAAVRATWPVCAIASVAGYRIALLQTSRELGCSTH